MAILGPLIVDAVTKGIMKQHLNANEVVDDVELEELLDPIIQPLNQYCK